MATTATPPSPHRSAVEIAPRSVWVETAPETDYPQLAEDIEVDVAVIGGGIFGLTTALLLRRGGLDVAVLEARRIGGGVTGHTTAKLTSLHGLTYAGLFSRAGRAGAHAYGEANEAGIARVADLIDQLEIDCDFRRRPNFTYAASRSDRAKVEKEAEVAERLGLPASFVEDVDLPFETHGAVRFEDQAEFHPLRYAQGLAAAMGDDDGAVYERTRVVRLDQGDPCKLRTEGGHVVRAGHVVVATHFPIFDRGVFFARMTPKRSYALAARIAGEVPSGMYLSTAANSLRSVPIGGQELLIVGGQGHDSGHGDTRKRYEALERWARERFPVDRIEYAWSAQDGMPADSMPFIGRLWPFSDRVWTATGFRKWGLAFGTAAAMMIGDAIEGRENRWLETFDSSRLGRPARLQRVKGIVKDNASVAFRFFSDRLRRGSASDLPPGEGRVVRSGLGQSAVYRDDSGAVHSVSARCSHLGCIVSWNAAERTWDCPCHGSRFGIDGEVIEGPAVSPLAPD